MQPRSSLIVLDSSTVGDLARDIANPSAPSHRDACRLFDLLASDRWIPALSFIQINEIAQHPNRRVVANRVQLLQRLPRIAWIRNTMPDAAWPETQHYGSVLDLIYSEAIAWRFDTVPPGLCLARRDDVILVAKSDSFVEAMVLNAGEARRRLGSDQHARSVASLTYALLKQAPKLTVGEARRRITRNPRTIAKNLAELARRVASELAASADPRATRIPAAFDETMHEFAADSVGMISSASADPMETYLAQHGLDLSDVTDDTSLRDVGDLAAFRATLRMLLDTRPNALSPQQVKSMRPIMLPSCRVTILLRRKQLEQDKPKGSDLHDASIAPMALYCDRAFVDRRTQELLGRVRRENPDLDAALCRTMTWSGPTRALEVLQRS